MGSFLQLQAKQNAFLIALVAAYGLTHLLFLTRLPIFTDEAVNINRASDTFQSFHNFKNLGLWDGKWLTVKIMGVFLNLPIDPLLSIRVSSILFGAGTLVACVAIGKMLFSRNVGLAAGCLFVLLPYAFFFNRVAVSDNYLAAFGAWVLLLSIVVVRSNNRIYEALLALVMIGAILSKLSGVFLLILPVLAALVLVQRAEWRRSLLSVSPALLSGLVVLSVLIWKESGTKQAGERAGILDPSELWHNLGLAADWGWSLLTPPLAVLVLVAVVAAWRIDDRSYRFVTLVVLGVVLPYLLLTIFIVPRYFLFAVVPTALLLARFASIVGFQANRWVPTRRWHASRRAVSVLLAVGALGLLIWPAFMSATILLRPAEVNLPREIRVQFVTGRGAGYGLNELVEFLKERAAQERDGINVLRFRYPGPLRDGLDVYLPSSESLSIYYLDFSGPDVNARAVLDANVRPTFLLLHPPAEAVQLGLIGGSLEPYLKGATRVWRYPKPGGVYQIEVWEIS